MAINSSPPKLVVRTGWRFSLRTLLILLLIAAIPLALVSRWRSSKLREHAAAKRLKELGLEVKMRRPDMPPGSNAADEPWYAVLLPPDHTNLVVWVRVPQGRSLTTESLQLLCELPNLIRLELVHQSAWRDVSLKPLGSLPQLQLLALKCSGKELQHFSKQRRLHEVMLGGEGVSDDCKLLLQNNPQLTSVTLVETATSDAIAPQLARLQDLLYLQLIDTKMTSASILQLSELPILQNLILVGPGFDDTAIPAIVKMQSLRYFSEDNTRISADGIEQIRQALPNCKIQ